VRFRLVVDGESHAIEVKTSPRSIVVHVDGVAYPAQGRTRGTDFEVRVRGIPHRIRFDGSHLWIDGREHIVAVDGLEEPASAAVSGVNREDRRRVEVRTPMPGRLVRLSAVAGTEVRRGQALAVLEAMKMQNEIASPVDAVVKEVLVNEGDTLTTDRIIVVLETRSARGR
jgi:pyruvate carboxylase subunit B